MSCHPCSERPGDSYAGVADGPYSGCHQAQPSSLNSRSSRAVVLFGARHHKLWDMVKTELKKIVPPEAYAQSEAMVDGRFRAGFSTVLFFEETDVIKDLQQKFALYADIFPVWSAHATGIAQFAVWTTLAQEKIGASLQHYNPSSTSRC